MTEPNEPDAGHLDLETLADLAEGLLSPEQTAAAEAHLEGCDQCRDDLAALTAVREQLAADATSLTMPDDVATRLHEALAAEQPLTPAHDDDEPPAEPWAPAAVTTLPERARDRDRRRNQWLAGLAVAAVIALFAVGISVLPHSSESKSSAASATSAAPAVPATTSGRNYTKAGLADQALGLIGQGGAPASSAAAGGSSAAASSAPASSAAASSAPASAAPASAGSPSTAAASSAASAPASSAASSSTAASAATGGGGRTPAGAGQDTSAATSSTPAAAPSTDALAALRKPGAAQACLSSYASAAGAPLAIDFATFEGKPAVIGVFNDPNHAGRFEVVAVGPPGCSLYEFAFPTSS